MIECPFCGESIEEDDLVYEFNWGEVVTYLNNRKRLYSESAKEYLERPFYVTFKYDCHGRPLLDTCSTVVNEELHHADDPMRSNNSDWLRVVHMLSGKRIFEVRCDDDNRSLPISACILPLIKHHKKHTLPGAEGESTGIFCPYCEQQLKSEILNAKSEVRIVLSGRPGSGKTVYVTQAISELMQGRVAQEFNIEPANNSVLNHYNENKKHLQAMGKDFVLATNPGAVQEPYIFLLRKGDSTVRLVIQDIAGEDTENRTKYSRAVRKADMLLFFVDPWHIEEVRFAHRANNDPTNAIVERSTMGKYSDLSGVFQQMMSSIDKKYAEDNEQLAGMLLIKGDYLIPSMLEQDNQPECQMMKQHIPFGNSEEMEFAIGMRSSFIRQYMYEWDSTRIFARDVESKYPARNTRYFVASALGQSTHLRQNSADEKPSDFEDPDSQFKVSNSKKKPKTNEWNYGEQVLEAPADPQHVIDPILWCMKRKGIWN